MPIRSSFLLAAAFACATLPLAGCDRAPVRQAEAGTAAAPAAGATDRLVARGRYLVAVMDCTGCHNSGSFSPDPTRGHLEGAEVGHEVPGLGIFYPPNLTPHPDAGLGRWSEDEIAAAIRTGRRPDGRELSGAMPWRSYAALTDEDARAVAAYLKSLPPSPHRAAPPATAETAPGPYLALRMPEEQADGR